LSNESYLLDTQILLWMDGKPEKISRRLQASLDAGSEIYFSAASRPLAVLAERFGFLELPVTARYAETAAVLPLHHKDPFDRMIVAQAMEEGVTLVTADSRLASYDLKILQV
jgi:PIN domain nuclease of toxin-antitoxin system